MAANISSLIARHLYLQVANVTPMKSVMITIPKVLKNMKNLKKKRLKRKKSIIMNAISGKIVMKTMGQITYLSFA